LPGSKSTGSTRSPISSRKRTAVVKESVDLLYNLVVLWSELGIAASEIWAEMDRRQALLGMAEKLPKDGEEAPMSPAGQ
jgi:phosphoribosyl-ATP pyrophosphohydrolase